MTYLDEAFEEARRALYAQQQQMNQTVRQPTDRRQAPLALTQAPAAQDSSVAQIKAGGVHPELMEQMLWAMHEALDTHFPTVRRFMPCRTSLRAIADDLHIAIQLADAADTE